MASESSLLKFGSQGIIYNNIRQIIEKPDMNTIQPQATITALNYMEKIDRLNVRNDDRLPRVQYSRISV